jgi:hypothetical protein
MDDFDFDIVNLMYALDTIQVHVRHLIVWVVTGVCKEPILYDNEGHPIGGLSQAEITHICTLWVRKNLHQQH